MWSHDMEMKNIRVRLTPSTRTSYAIQIKSGLLVSLPATLASAYRGRRIFIITDANVAAYYASRFHRRIVQEGAETVLLEVAPGELSKSHAVVHALHTKLLAYGVRRDSVVMAIGGGVVGDLAGYVAATILRGISYVHIPTTLLAQVDSSVGGKVGINHARGKNLIGAFHQPDGVFIDPDVLHTLPAVEFRNGLAEGVKIAAALDGGFFEYLERSSFALRKGNTRLLSQVIHTAVGLKAGVVSRDEREQGLRKVLNLGHTLGHAVESATGYAIPHGYAIAAGMAAEAKIAVDMGFLRSKEYRRLVTVLQTLRLPTRLPGSLNRKTFLGALNVDKKAEGGGTRFVLLKSIGESMIGVDVPQNLIEAVL
jgi:3-dehydroquinate synthase